MSCWCYPGCTGVLDGNSPKTNKVDSPSSSEFLDNILTILHSSLQLFSFDKTIHQFRETTLELQELTSTLNWLDPFIFYTHNYYPPHTLLPTLSLQPFSSLSITCFEVSKKTNQGPGKTTFSVNNPQLKAVNASEPYCLPSTKYPTHTLLYFAKLFCIITPNNHTYLLTWFLFTWHYNLRRVWGIYSIHTQHTSSAYRPSTTPLYRTLPFTLPLLIFSHQIRWSYYSISSATKTSESTLALPVCVHTTPESLDKWGLLPCLYFLSWNWRYHDKIRSPSIVSLF